MKTLAAFIARKRWEQAALAEEVGVTVRALRRVLVDLETSGIPLSRKEHNRREVHWSVPDAWLPKGAVLSNTQAATVVRLLGRVPRSDSRDEVLRVLVGPAALALARADREDATSVLASLEDALRDRRAVRLVYAAASATAPRPRAVSIQHLAYGPHVRFVGVEHAIGKLTWYRADRVRQISPLPTEPYLAVAEEDVRAFVAGSADGFARGSTVLCRFAVRAPASGWVPGNLPVSGAKITRGEDGSVEIEVETAGVEVLARFVVGLGGEARALTPELGERVRKIATGALGTGSAPGDGPSREIGGEVRTGRNRAGLGWEDGATEAAVGSVHSPRLVDGRANREVGR